MVFVLVVAMFMVYGVTLILVQGTIFNGIRNFLSQNIYKIEKALHPSTEEVLELIEASPKSINMKLLKIYQELQNSIAITDPNNPNFKKLLDMFEDVKNKIIKSVNKSRQTYLRKCNLWFLLKIQKLMSCMMCMGFWIGLFICIVSLFVNISICGVPFHIVTTKSLCDTTVTCFLLSCMFSGTTWMIHALVDTLDEIKEHIGNIISKR